MSKRIPPRPAERYWGGDLWEKPTKPDEGSHYLRQSYSVPKKALNAGDHYTDEDGQADNYVDLHWLATRDQYGPDESVPKDVQRQITAESSNRLQAIRAEEMRKREAENLGARVRDMYLRAMRAGIDLPDETKQLEAILEAGKRKLQAAA